ncbi:hypothetical protein ACFLUM_01870 [Chloroflexota bacterium]
MTVVRMLVICYALLILGLFPSRAYAYLDPGAGSYFFQILLAALVGLGFVLRVYWKKVKAFAASLFSKEVGTPSHGQEDVDA